MADFELEGGLSGEDTGENPVERYAEGGSCYTKVERCTDVEFTGFEELEGIFAEGRRVFGFAGGTVSGKESVVACLGSFQGTTGFLEEVSNSIHR